MKKLQILTTMLFLSVILNAQTLPFAMVGAEWHYDYYIEGPVTAYMKIHAEKDTIINGKNCSMMIRSAKSYCHLTNKYSDEYIIDTNYMAKELDKVLLLRGDTFYTIYDFSLDIGDSLIIPASVYSEELDSTGCFHVLNKGDTLINGKSFRYIDVYSKWPALYIEDEGYHWGYNGIILEDIGPLKSDLFPNQQVYSFPPGYNNGAKIRCYSDSSFAMQLVTCDSILSIQDYSDSKPISIYPNPAKNEINIVLQKNEDFNISIFDISGKIISNTYESTGETGIVSIDISDLVSSIYIIEAKGKNIYRAKFVKK
ncbi:MAG: T9SS type A sorting domain-containing protein [Bacteroidales bacterium]|nr:T9SS type A sorting domain-containing protein [Bacteroidales bacterium]